MQATPEEDEATAAALAHLRALEEAERFEPGPTPEADDKPRVASLLERPRLEYTPSEQVTRTYAAPVHTGMPQRAIQAPPQPTVVQSAVSMSVAPQAVPLPVPKDLRTIEDIYAVYPVGDGETYMRVERVLPKAWKGVPVAGVLGDIYERISMDEFAARFGGHVYAIHVVGRAPSKVAITDAPIRTLTTVELKVPGQPVMEDEMRPGMTRGPMGQMFSQNGGYPPGFPGAPAGVPESVLLEQLRAEERARERQEQERSELMNRARMPDEVINAVTYASKNAVEIANAGANEKVAILREQNQSLIDSLSRREEEVRTLREKLLLSERAAAEARQFTETEQIKRINEMHNATVQKMQDDHSREVNRLLQESRDKLSEETRRHVDDRSRAEMEGLRERQRLQEDGDRRERAMKEQHDLIRLQMKEQYDQRIADLERRTSEQIAAVKEQRDREIESVRTSTRAEATVVEKTSTFRVDHLQARVMELSSENDRLRREAEELRRKGQKEPVAYLQECATVARDLLGMVKPEEVEKEGGGGEAAADNSWKGIAARGLMGLVDGLPKIVEQVGAVRAANQQAQAQQQAQQQAQVVQVQQAQQRAMQQAQMQQMAAARASQQVRGLPPSPQEMMTAPVSQRRRALVAPTPAWGGAPPPPGAAVGMPAAYAGPVVAPPPAPVTRPVPSVVSGLPGAAATAPVTGQMVYQSASPLQSESTPVAAPEPMAGPPSAEAPQGEAPQVTQEAIMQFISALNEHISEGTPVELFAYGFVNQVGKPVAADLITKISADDLLASVAEADGGDASYILTSNGRDYVKKLWVEAKKIVSQPD